MPAPLGHAPNPVALGAISTGRDHPQPAAIVRVKGVAHGALGLRSPARCEAIEYRLDSTVNEVFMKRIDHPVVGERRDALRHR